METAPPENSHCLLKIRISSDLKEESTKAAESLELSLSAFTRLALQSYIENKRSKGESES